MQMTGVHMMTKEVPDRNRRELSRFKCDECRRRKKKCLPENRVWPEICVYCSRTGLPCSRPRPPQSSISKRVRTNSQTPISIAATDEIVGTRLEDEEATTSVETKEIAAGQGANIVRLGDKSEKRELQDNGRESLISSLAYHGMTSRPHNIMKGHPETCGWLLRHPVFTDWKNPGKQGKHAGLLSLKGKPGSGKSTLMKFLLDEAKRTWTDRTIMAHFFNARGHELEKSSLGFFRSIMHQLLSTHEIARSMFMAEFSSKLSTDGEDDWTEMELYNFLIQLVEAGHLHRSVILIDAVDECGCVDVRQMVWRLEELADRSMSAGVSIHLCVASRHYPHITFRKGLNIIVEAELGHHQDIERYTESCLSIIEQPGGDLQRELIEKSAGVFLWVVLTTRHLISGYEKGDNIDELSLQLQSCPSDMAQLYRSIIDTSLDNADEGTAVLQWALASQRPLSALELYLGARATSTSSHDSNPAIPESKFVCRYILDRSRGLIEVSQHPDSTVQFIHETVPGFLSPRDAFMSVGGTEARGGPFLFQLDSCHSAVAKGCLAYLSDTCNVVASGRHLLEQRPLLRYAAEYWWQHMKLSHGKHTDLTHRLALRLLTYRTTELLAWLRVYNVEEPSNIPNFSLQIDDLCSSVYYAALFGMPDLVRSVIALGDNVNVKEGRYGSALQAASAHGHTDSVKVLLDAGADVNAQGGQYGCALQAASAHGHTDSVKVLLDTGADVNAQGGQYGCALQAASAHGHTDSVKVLLDAGADVNAQGGQYGCALQAAAWKGMEEIVQLLLEAGSDVNAQGGFFSQALQASSAAGHETITQLLLDAGADVNARGGQYGSALHAASSCGHEKVARMLICSGADLESQDRYRSALQVASSGGHEGVVKALIDAGTDVNSRSQQFGSAVLAASVYGHRHIVDTLVAAGAQFNIDSMQRGSRL